MGATAATELAGVEVALGVDDWSVALSTFRRNHPGAAARGTSLPATWAALRVPPERAPEEGSVHAHFFAFVLTRAALGRRAPSRRIRGPAETHALGSLHSPRRLGFGDRWKNTRFIRCLPASVFHRQKFIADLRLLEKS